MGQAGWLSGWKARAGPKILSGMHLWGGICLRSSLFLKGEGAGENIGVGGGVAYSLGLCHSCWSSSMASAMKPTKSSSLGVTLVKHHL